MDIDGAEVPVITIDDCELTEQELEETNAFLTDLLGQTAPAVSPSQPKPNILCRTSPKFRIMAKSPNSTNAAKVRTISSPFSRSVHKNIQSLEQIEMPMPLLTVSGTVFDTKSIPSSRHIRTVHFKSGKISSSSSSLGNIKVVQTKNQTLPLSNPVSSTVNNLAVPPSGSHLAETVTAMLKMYSNANSGSNVHKPTPTQLLVPQMPMRPVSSVRLTTHTNMSIASLSTINSSKNVIRSAVNTTNSAGPSKVPRTQPVSLLHLASQTVKKSVYSLKQPSQVLMRPSSVSSEMLKTNQSHLPSPIRICSPRVSISSNNNIMVVKSGTIGNLDSNVNQYSTLTPNLTRVPGQPALANDKSAQHTLQLNGQTFQSIFKKSTPISIPIFTIPSGIAMPKTAVVMGSTADVATSAVASVADVATSAVASVADIATSAVASVADIADEKPVTEEEKAFIDSPLTELMSGTQSLTETNDTEEESARVRGLRLIADPKPSSQDSLQNSNTELFKNVVESENVEDVQILPSTSGGLDSGFTRSSQQKIHFNTKIQDLLQFTFDHNHFPSALAMARLAKAIGTTWAPLKNWFTMRRLHEKQSGCGLRDLLFSMCPYCYVSIEPVDREHCKRHLMSRQHLMMALGCDYFGGVPEPKSQWVIQDKRDNTVLAANQSQVKWVIQDKRDNTVLAAHSTCATGHVLGFGFAQNIKSKDAMVPTGRSKRKRGNLKEVCDSLKTELNSLKKTYKKSAAIVDNLSTGDCQINALHQSSLVSDSVIGNNVKDKLKLSPKTIFDSIKSPSLPKKPQVKNNQFVIDYLSTPDGLDKVNRISKLPQCLSEANVMTGQAVHSDDLTMVQSMFSSPVMPYQSQRMTFLPSMERNKNLPNLVVRLMKNRPFHERMPKLNSIFLGSHNQKSKYLHRTNGQNKNSRPATKALALEQIIGFRCPHCPKIFSTEWLMVKHSLEHKPFYCVLCSESMPSTIVFKMHMQDHFSASMGGSIGYKEFMCKVCYSLRCQCRKLPGNHITVPKPTLYRTPQLARRSKKTFLTQCNSGPNDHLRVTLNDYVLLCKQGGLDALLVGHQETIKIPMPTPTVKDSPTKAALTATFSASKNLSPLINEKAGWVCGENIPKVIQKESGIGILASRQSHKLFQADFEVSKSIKSKCVDEQYFLCEVCDMCFFSESDLKDHLVIHSSKMRRSQKPCGPPLPDVFESRKKITVEKQVSKINEQKIGLVMPDIFESKVERAPLSIGLKCKESTEPKGDDSHSFLSECGLLAASEDTDVTTQADSAGNLDRMNLPKKRKSHHDIEILSLTVDGKDQYGCPACSEHYNSAYEVRRHHQLLHTGTQLKAISTSKNIQMVRKPIVKKPKLKEVLQCIYCSKLCKNQYLLILHSRNCPSIPNHIQCILRSSLQKDCLDKLESFGYPLPYRMVNINGNKSLAVIKDVYLSEAKSAVPGDTLSSEKVSSSLEDMLYSNQLTSSPENVNLPDVNKTPSSNNSKLFENEVMTPDVENIHEDAVKFTLDITKLCPDHIKLGLPLPIEKLSPRNAILLKDFSKNDLAKVLNVAHPKVSTKIAFNLNDFTSNQQSLLPAADQLNELPLEEPNTTPVKTIPLITKAITPSPSQEEISFSLTANKPDKVIKVVLDKLPAVIKESHYELDLKSFEGFAECRSTERSLNLSPITGGNNSPLKKGVVNLVTVDQDKLLTSPPSKLKPYQVEPIQSTTLPVCRKNVAQVDCKEKLRKSVRSASNLNIPIAMQDAIFECSVCDLKFENRDSFEHHTIVVHTGDKVADETKNSLKNKFKCCKCSESFISELAMLAHSSLHQYGPKSGKYTCRMCKVSVVTYISLKEHVWQHLNFAPYSCLECNVNFTFGNTLKEHMLVVHKFDGVNDKNLKLWLPRKDGRYLAFNLANQAPCKITDGNGMLDDDFGSLESATEEVCITDRDFDVTTMTLTGAVCERNKNFQNNLPVEKLVSKTKDSPVDKPVFQPKQLFIEDCIPLQKSTSVEKPVSKLKQLHVDVPVMPKHDLIVENTILRTQYLRGGGKLISKKTSVNVEKPTSSRQQNLPIEKPVYRTRNRSDHSTETPTTRQGNRSADKTISLPRNKMAESCRSQTQSRTRSVEYSQMKNIETVNSKRKSTSNAMTRKRKLCVDFN